MEETQTINNDSTEFKSVFAEAEEMTLEQAINILIQVAGLAQETGKLNIRDSVLLARAISTVRPGSI
jgi:response regulator RpfG family c-di-GMP phosphodiesterase